MNGYTVSLWLKKLLVIKPISESAPLGGSKSAFDLAKANTNQKVTLKPILTAPACPFEWLHLMVRISSSQLDTLKGLSIESALDRVGAYYKANDEAGQHRLNIAYKGEEWEITVKEPLWFVSKGKPPQNGLKCVGGVSLVMYLTGWDFHRTAKFLLSH